MVFAIKMLLDNAYKLLNLLEFLKNEIIFKSLSVKQNLNLNIQILAGNLVNFWFSAAAACWFLNKLVFSTPPFFDKKKMDQTWRNHFDENFCEIDFTKII